MPSDKTITAYVDLMKTLGTNERWKVSALQNLENHFNAIARSNAVSPATQEKLRGFSKSINTLLNLNASKEERFKALDTMEGLKEFLESRPVDSDVKFPNNYAYIMNRAKNLRAPGSHLVESRDQRNLRFELDSISESMELGFKSETVEKEIV